MLAKHTPNEDPRYRDMLGKYYLAVFRNGRPLMIGPLEGDTITTQVQALNIATDIRGMRPITLLAA